MMKWIVKYVDPLECICAWLLIGLNVLCLTGICLFIKFCFYCIIGQQYN